MKVQQRQQRGNQKAQQRKQKQQKQKKRPKHKNLLSNFYAAPRVERIVDAILTATEKQTAPTPKHQQKMQRPIAKAATSTATATALLTCDWKESALAVKLRGQLIDQ